MSGFMTDPFALNLRHLLLLRFIARSGSISGAAQFANLSQPAMTQAVAGVERRLGRKLFDRHRQGMQPTTAGRTLVARIEEAHLHLERGARALNAARGARGFERLERLVGFGHLRALTAVVREGSFALAARALELSEPSIHRAARELEDIAGLPLLQRHGRTVRPTPAAERFAQHAALAIHEIQTGLLELAALDGGADRIVVGSMPLGRAMLVPRAVARLLGERSNVVVAIVDGQYADLLSQLRVGEVDLLVGALREPPPAPDVVQEPLFEDRLVIVGRKGHPMATGRVDGARLGAYPWVISRRGTPLRAQWKALFDRHEVAEPRDPIECSSVMAIRGLLLAGDWLTLLSPDQYRYEAEAGLLVAIGEALPDSQRIIGATVRRDWRPTSAQSAFLSILREEAGLSEKQ